MPQGDQSTTVTARPSRGCASRELYNTSPIPESGSSLATDGLRPGRAPESFTGNRSRISWDGLARRLTASPLGDRLTVEIDHSLGDHVGVEAFFAGSRGLSTELSRPRGVV